MRPRFRIWPLPVRHGPNALTDPQFSTVLAMPHLLNVWPRVSRQIAGSDHVLLLSDYDGTLAPIAGRPDLAVLPSKTREALMAVNQNDRFSLGIVSGRGLADVKEMVNIPEVVYAGNHGLEIEGTERAFVHHEARELMAHLDVLLRALTERLEGLQGVYVEGKGLTLSVHYRLTPEDVRPKVMASFDEVMGRAADKDKVRITRGKEILEVRPAVDWHKGRAIARIAGTFPAGTLVIYIGDDLTDEDGFEAVHELNGISVFVGPARQPTKAMYRVDSPAEVAETLELLARL